MALLDRVPTSKVKHSLEENLALIDSRIQYLEELKAETKPSESGSGKFKNDTNNNNGDEYLASLGQPIECFDNQGNFSINSFLFVLFLMKADKPNLCNCLLIYQKYNIFSGVLFRNFYAFVFIVNTYFFT